MSVNPVSFIAMNETAGGQANRRAVPIPKSSSGEGAAPEFGTVPKRRAHDPEGEQRFSEMWRDEVQVQVQRDSESNNEIVIKYVDRSGNLILQIPSSQVLGLARAIEQALAEQATERENARQAASEGGESRGH